MIENLRKFKKELEVGYKTEIKIPPNYKNVKNIVIAGMGASIIPGEIIKDTVSLKIPLEISKNYDLPSFAGANTLLICVSRSGNVKETISQLEQGIKNKCKIIVVSLGGEISKRAQKLKIPLIKIPEEFSQRETREIFSYLFGLLFGLVKKLNLTEKTLSFEILEKEKNNIEKEAKNLALEIKDVFPVICSEFNSLNFRWKSDLSESGKMITNSAVLPEIAHNELEGWQNLNNKYCLIFLRNQKEKREIKILIEAIKKIIKKEVGIIEIYGKGKNQLEETLYFVWLGGLTSYFIGKQKGIDPKETRYIKMMKEELKKFS
jgi:glucose/mannose-6-phosphate isomerase